MGRELLPTPGSPMTRHRLAAAPPSLVPARFVVAVTAVMEQVGVYG